MTAMSNAKSVAANGIIQRYYLAMAVPFGIDIVTSAIYALINSDPLALLPISAVSAIFLVLGVGLGAYFLIRPIRRYLTGEAAFGVTEAAIAALPRRSAILMVAMYGPLMALRVLLPHAGVTFGAYIEVAAWIDTVVTFVVATAFTGILTYFVVSAYLDRLCEHLFVTHGVNIGTFHGTFRSKVGLAVLFGSLAGIFLLAGDIASYSGDRLVREAAVDFISAVVAAGIVYTWVAQTLTRPIGRLDQGMRQVAEGDLEVRLPVTSTDEVGRATGGFNQMVEGLSERQYLRDTFGKYVHESVATAILENQEAGGRVADTLAEATLMFTDIEGFTALSEGLAPADVARVLNVYFGTIVPVIQRHGGVVNSCIGDGVFASFNLPLRLERHAAAALQAAIDMQRALAGATFPAGLVIRTRIGINTGPVVGVTIGTARWLSYTLLGDAVNIASRVEQINKQFGSLILATESTVRAAGDGFPCERLGETGIRGHRGDIVVYRVDHRA
jgi:class 3 adenylate cyclase